jgi:MFS family permease
MVILFLDAVAMSMILPALPHLLVGLTGTTLGEAAFRGGLLSASCALMRFLCGPLVGNQSDCFGLKPVALLAIGTHCLDFVILSLSEVFWFLFVGRVLAGITAASFTDAAFGFTPFMTGVSYAILGLARAATLRRPVKTAVAALGEFRTVRYAIFCGIATLSSMVLGTDCTVFLAMIPLRSVAFVVAPTIRGMMSQRMGEDRQGELMGLSAAL